MKDTLLHSLKLLAKERQVIIALSVFTVATLAFMIYVSVNIHASELKLVSHYSAFGSTNFYRDAWYYLINFAVFGLAVFVGHVFITLKLLAVKGNELALAFVWMSVVIVAIAAAIAHQVLRVAALA